MQFAFFALIPDPETRQVLAVHENGRWVLPQFTADTPSFKWPVPMNVAVADWLGVPVTVRRYLRNPIPMSNDETWVVVFELHALLPSLPPGSHWIDREDLVAANRDYPPLYQLIRAWLVEHDAHESVPAVRPSWDSIGWWSTANAWITEQLDAHGIRHTGPVTQFKWGATAVILQAPTTAGAIFFKATAPLLGREAQITRQLADHFASFLPDLIASDEQRNWLLMHQLPGVPLFKCAELTEWEAAMRAIAAIQIGATQYGSQLLEWGCADRRVARLAGQYQQLLGDLAAPEWQQVYTVTAEEVTHLQHCLPTVETLCTQLERYGIPDSIGHGDLHAGNIMVAVETVTIFDWTAGALTHPFFDLLTLIGEGGGPAGASDGATIAHLVQIYLVPWCDQHGKEAVEAAFTLSQQLAPLYMALIYCQITRGIEPDAWWEWSPEVGAYLRMFLDRIDKAPLS